MKFSAVALLTAAMACGADAYRYRFYADRNCDHGARNDRTYPANNRDPLTGNAGTCYNSPSGTNWQRVEIDNPPNAVITFCSANCQGSGTVQQRGGHCFVPFNNCAVRSFKVVV